MINLTQVELNFVTVLIAAVASMVVGSLWYSPVLFAKQWVKLVKLSENEMKAGMVRSMIIASVLALVEAYVLAYFVKYSGATTAAGGMLTGFWAWLGFVATTVGVQGVFENRPNQLTMINLGHHLVNLLVMGAILAMWP